MREYILQKLKNANLPEFRFLDPLLNHNDIAQPGEHPEGPFVHRMAYCAVRNRAHRRDRCAGQRAPLLPSAHNNKKATVDIALVVFRLNQMVGGVFWSTFSSGEMEKFSPARYAGRPEW